MMNNLQQNLTVLVVEDNTTMREGMLRVAQKLDYTVIGVADAETALREIEKRKPDIVISDYKLPGHNGIELLEQIKRLSPETEVLMVTAFGTIELAVEAVQKGAADFITKPFSPEELTIKINLLFERLRDKSELRRVSEENRYLRDEIDSKLNYGEIVGRSAKMQSIYRTIEKVARGDSSVIIYGESGTGKELVARAIHKAGSRKDRAFVRVNCGALAEGVLESELFGHERGAFTGALKRKKGRFELAQHGTIFLDEIGDIPLATQIKLLRVLQERQFERVGGEETLNADIRVIAATNKNLLEQIKTGDFREDLYYRLHIIPLNLPPLRERKEDIPLLTEHFIKKIAADLKMPNLKITDSARQGLLQYDWPGNIRELENIIERAAVLCDKNCITANDLPFTVLAEEHNAPPADTLDLTLSLENVERRLIKKAMSQANGVKTEAAKLLGIKAGALYYKLEKYGLI